MLSSSSTGSHRSSGGGEIVTIQCGAAANWIGAQYHLLQNSNCDPNAAFTRAAHFRRSATAAKSAASAIVGEHTDAPNEWQPRVVCMEASVGLDGIVATFANEPEYAGDTAQEERMSQYASRAQRNQQQQASAAKPAKQATARPTQWTDLSKRVMTYHSKSQYSVPGLYEGTSDFHLHTQGVELMDREAVHEEVVDRTRWFLEECDQPDGLHVLVDANSGWSGVGSALLGRLRDEYERIPIFCISALMPPAPASLLGQSFSSRTTLLQSVLNSSLLLSAASQLATAYMPLTTHYWAASPLAQQALPQAHAAIQRGELYESSTMLAWMIHLVTAEYRLQPRTMNMATALASLTQQSPANVISARLQTQLDGQLSDSHANLQSSSLLTANSPVLHTHPLSIPLSFFGHEHAFRPEAPDATTLSPATPENEVEARREAAVCGVRTNLLETVHVFGRTEETSHAELVHRMEAQPQAVLRRVYGTSHMNLPPSFPIAYYDLLNEGHVLSLYRCQAAGRELGQFGTWLSRLNRGAVNASNYTTVSAVGAGGFTDASMPVVLSHMQPNRARHATPLDDDGEQTRGHAISEQLLQTQWSQEELDEFAECGATLQNLAEDY